MPLPRTPAALALVALTHGPAGCAPDPEGLLRTPPGRGPRVVVDFQATPLPEIPFPNDLATRPDPGAPTGLRLNLPVDTDLDFERHVRENLNKLDGFGIFTPISVAFDAPIALDTMLARQRDRGPVEDDAIYLVDVDPRSPEQGRLVPLDFQTGRFPQDSTTRGQYLANDPRDGQPSLLFETVEEDLDGDGILDPGEDSDDDGILDHPNVWPPEGDPRLDLLTCWDLPSNTLFLRPVTPLRERTRYAVVLTSALVDVRGEPVRSPWEWVNHTRQTEALEPVVDALAAVGRGREEIAFAWTFTTGSVTTELWELAEGIRGRGEQRWLADAFPAGITEAARLHDRPDLADPYTLPPDMVIGPLADVGILPDYSIDLVGDAYQSFSERAVGGAFVAADFLYDHDGDGDDSDEVWTVDADGRYEARPRRIAFTCVIPKESAPGAPNARHAPWPIAIHMHGYGSTRVEFFAFAHELNREGVAVCGIDAPGQGIALSGTEEDFVGALLDLTDTRPLWWHLLDDRVRDLDNDGIGDPAADMLTADPFHTRDMLRQPILDVTQLMESLRRCGTGQMERTIPTEDGPQYTGEFTTTCDWDGDGEIDLGGPDTVFRMNGVSQGGIMTAMSIAVNDSPVAVTTVPGGGLVDVGLRTDISGVSWAITGRALSPAIVTRRAASGTLQLAQDVISVDQEVLLPFADLPTWPEGGSVVVRNLTLGREEVGHFGADGWLRVPIAANAPTAIEKRALAGVPEEGPAINGRYGVPGNAGLGDALEVEIRDAAGRVVRTIDTFELAATNEAVTYDAGSPLVAGSWGLGLRRASHDLQRVLSVQALAIERGDPIAYARRWRDEPFAEPKNVLVHLTAGDTSVPIASGIALARAAGLVDGEAVDPRYGATVDEWLVDRGVIHGLEEWGPWRDDSGRAILFDADDLDDGTDGTGAPSDAPLRISVPVDGGVMGLRVLYVNPTGQHAYYVPNEDAAFDWSLFSANQMARYLSTVGREISDDPCMATRECPFFRPFEDTP